MAKFEVKIGEEFVAEGVEIEDVDELVRLAELVEKQRVARRNDRRVDAMFVVCLASVAVAAGIGMNDGSFNELRAVWSVVTIPLGLVLYPILRKKGLIANHGKDAD